MRAQKRHAIGTMLFIIGLSFLVVGFARAADYPDESGGETPGKNALWKADVNYDIYYEVSAYEINRVENVHVVDTVVINGRAFLVIRYADVAAREGYIALDSVHAILPTSAAKPYRTSDTRRSSY